MTVIVNGKRIDDISNGATVEQLLLQLGIPLKKVAVERNLEIVPKSRFADIKLDDGDRLEIIHFIGGG